jgi:ketosteroid isomerase-like protein
MTSLNETSAADVVAVDNAFFEALRAGDHRAIDSILTDDFLIIDVVSGGVSERDTILGALESGALRFVEVIRDPDAVSLRHRSGTAVIVGRTTMVMRFDQNATTVQSRYTHVFVQDGGRWRLLNAQGTPIV